MSSDKIPDGRIIEGVTGSDVVVHVTDQKDSIVSIGTSAEMPSFLGKEETKILIRFLEKSLRQFESQAND